MGAHPLITYVYETFGQQFGGLLLAGYGEKLGEAPKRIYVIEKADGEETDWVIKLVTNHLPRGKEPLVLAALLTLMLRRPNISYRLEFELDELLAVLQWRDNKRTHRLVDTAISCYVRLLYDKQINERAGKNPPTYSGGGYYHLLTGYVRGGKSATGASLVRASSEVYFDSGFISGLKQGRVYFAGIDFRAI
ncbi:MAG: hypothetical protein QOH49_2803 [Acidobacteriota bacterium]|jgi:hypothetical protein|nr:hypothetical protein [Acidobacteriota bacterium]